jgi:RHS repeat-associated protein
MTVTNYLWDIDSYLEEYDGLGVTTATYTNEPTEYGSVVSQRRNITTSYYQYDVQGSTHQLIDKNENITDTFLYDAWGNQVARTGSTNTPFGYIGEFGYFYDEETLSYYVRARVYESIIGRWISPDPLDFVDDFNLYLYDLNNPINFLDPSGSLTITRRDNEIVSKELRRPDDPKCPTPYYAVGWEFSIDKWPCRGNKGIFFQQVDVNCDSCNCAKNSKCPTKKFTYYEKWPVITVPKGVKKNQKITLSVKDYAKFQAKRFTKGIYEQIGSVRFYCVSPTKARMKGELFEADTLTTGIWSKSGYVEKGPCKTSSGDLKRTITPPHTWGEEPADSASDNRTFLMSWDCCCNKNPNSAGGVYADP